MGTKARRHATVRSEMVVIDKESKREQHRDARARERRIKESDPLEHQGPLAVVKVANGVTLSMGFQSVRVDVGVDLPWPVPKEIDSMKEALSNGFDFAYQLIDDELSARAKEMEGLLRQINKRYGHR